VQALPSLHVFVLFTVWHAPAASQKSLVHGLLSLQTFGVPAHVPLPQTSFSVHGLWSSHVLVLFV
jgi:hypothetical protein